MCDDDDNRPSVHFTCSSVQCSSDIASLFDSDIQSMLGLVLLYDALQQQATKSEPNQEHVYMYISVTTFAHYIRLRCYQKLFMSLGIKKARHALDTAITEFINHMIHLLSRSLIDTRASDPYLFDYTGHRSP